MQLADKKLDVTCRDNGLGQHRPDTAIDITQNTVNLEGVSIATKYLIQNLQQKRRQPKEIRGLLPILKESRFIKERNMDDDLILKIASIAGYRFCQADETVFSQDDKADCFYLVLHGLVEVRIRNKNYSD